MTFESDRIKFPVDMRMKSELFRAISEEEVKSLSDPAVYAHGSKLYASGHVKTLVIRANAIETDVTEENGNSFHVMVIEVEGRIKSSCSCGYVLSDKCPHAVAVLLDWINVRDSMGELRRMKKVKKIEEERGRINRFLLNQPKQSLVNVIMEQVGESKELSRKLNIEASLCTGINHDVDVYKRQIDEIFDVDYVGYWKALEYILNLDLLKRKIDALIDQGRCAEADEALRYFLKIAKAKVNNVSDSDGNYVRFVRTLYDSYARVLKGLNASPGTIASWVYDEIKSDGYGFADELLDQIVEVLQIEGFKVIENMAWQDFINCAKQVDKPAGYDLQKQRFKHVLMNIAEITNNDELYLKTCEVTLDLGPYEYLVLAKKLVSIKRIDEAITRLTEGISRYPNDKGIILHNMLSQLYEKKGELEKAYEYACSTLAKQSSNYPRVRSLALKLKTWDKIKPEIVNILMKGGHFSELIELYLEDNQLLEAIEIAKRDDVVTSMNWRVAELAEKNYPYDSILLYKRFVDYHVNLKTKSEYKEAAKVAHMIKKLYNSLGQITEWNEYIANLRKMNKCKMNLLKVLEKL